MKMIVKIIAALISSVILNGCIGGFVATGSGIYPYGGVYYTVPVYPYAAPPGYYLRYPNYHNHGGGMYHYHHHR